MNNQDFLLKRIGELAVEYVRANDEYDRIVLDEFERGVARECVVSRVDPAWRDVTAARVRFEAEVRGYLEDKLCE